MRRLVPMGLFLAAVCAAVPAPRPAPPSGGAAVYQVALPGVALVQAPGGRGSGWVVDRARRWIVTCHHVVGDGDGCEVIFPWRSAGEIVGPRRLYLAAMPELRRRGLAVPGRVVRRDPSLDLALVEVERLPEEARALPLAETGARPGQRVHVVGNRFDLDTLWGYATGRVRARRRLKEGYFTAGKRLAEGAEVLLAGVPINEGDSGSPLLDDHGRVVGVSAAIVWRAHGDGLFVDLPALRRFLAVAPPRLPTPADVYHAGVRSVALVQYEGGERFAGVLVDRARRLVLTTAEAVAKEKAVRVSFAVEQSAGVVAEAAWYRAEADLLRRKGVLSTGVVLAVDARRNLALVEAGAVPAAATEVTFARPPRPGDGLHLISHPQRLEVLWVYGRAWLRQREQRGLGLTGDGPPPAVLVLQAALAEGEGGGPVLDDTGALAGLVSGRVAAQQQAAYAVAVEEVRGFLESARPTARPLTAAEHAARGELFAQAREDERAVAAYSAAGDFAPALAGRALAHLRLGRLERGRADAEAAVKLAPRLPAAWCARAAVWCARNEPGRAAGDCDRALAIEPRCAPALALRAQARLLQGDAVRARDDASEAIWLDARLAAAYRVRGQAYVVAGDRDRAAADLTQAVRLDPHDVEALRRRGDVHWEHGDIAAALADHTAVLRMVPGDAHALHGRGRCRSARGEHAAALADLDAALRAEPGRVEALVDRGGVQIARGDYRAAAADLAAAARRRPRLAAAEAERRTADLPGGDRDERAGCVEVCEAVLRAIAAANGGVRRAVDEGLAAAAAEKDLAARGRLLRRLLARVSVEKRQEGP